MFQATIASLQAQVKSGAVDPLLTHELEQLRNIRFVASYLLFFVHSVADPDVFAFLGLLDPDPLVRDTDPDPFIIKQKVFGFLTYYL